MYCSSCGAAVTPGLTYCNRCGAELKTNELNANRRTQVSIDSLVWAIASVTIVGLGVLIGLMAVMKEVLHFHDGLIIAFSLLAFLTFLGIDIVFVWQLVRLNSNARQAAKIIQQKGIATKELDEARALPEPLLSVTDHTTRTLEHTDKARKTE